MTRSGTAALVLALALSASFLPAQKQPEHGLWRASSKTARAITGDVAFAGEKFGINFLSFPLAQIQTVPAADLKRLFHLVAEPAHDGNLYRLNIPGSTRFLHKNNLCGAEDTQWLITLAEGKELQIAMFSGEKIPSLTAEALATGTDLCGTYSYTR